MKEKMQLKQGDNCEKTISFGPRFFKHDCNGQPICRTG